MIRTFLLVIPVILLVPVTAPAVSITGQQTAANEWTYNLTFTPLDNYSIFQPTTTITLTGLFGVVGAAGPTSTDFPPFLDAVNLDWTAEVLDGGTTVRWTHIGPGTGNSPDERHIFGFRVFARIATGSLVPLTTSGFSRDRNNPLPDGTFDLDIAGLVAGPVARVVTFDDLSGNIGRIPNGYGGISWDMGIGTPDDSFGLDWWYWDPIGALC